VRQKFTAVKSSQARGYFSPEPGIVVQIILDKLLDVLIRVATIVLGNTIKFRFQLGTEMYFHRLQSNKVKKGYSIPFTRCKN
jgi:hypothetical protein